MNKSFNHNTGPSILLSSNQLNPSAPWAGSDLLALGEPPLSSRIIRGQGWYQFFLFSSLLSLLSELDGVDKPHSCIFFASNDCHTGGDTVFGTPYNVVQRPITTFKSLSLLFPFLNFKTKISEMYLPLYLESWE